MNTQHNTTHDCVRPPVHEKKELCDLDYSQDPPRILSNYLVHAPKPFNAEPHLPLLVNAGLITPTDVFFKRNHGPIPDIRLEDHQVYIGVQTLNESQPVEWKALNMHDIMTRWPKATITASLQVTHYGRYFFLFLHKGAVMDTHSESEREREEKNSACAASQRHNHYRQFNSRRSLVNCALE